MLERIKPEDVKKGQAVIYHVGSLPHDRAKDPELNDLAWKLLGLSCAGYVRMACNEKSLSGTGSFELKQRRVRSGVYEYLAKRLK